MIWWWIGNAVFLLVVIPLVPTFWITGSPLPGSWNRSPSSIRLEIWWGKPWSRPPATCRPSKVGSKQTGQAARGGEGDRCRW
jgi:hypothetical protein